MASTFEGLSSEFTTIVEDITRPMELTLTTPFSAGSALTTDDMSTVAQAPLQVTDASAGAASGEPISAALLAAPTSAA